MKLRSVTLKESILWLNHSTTQLVIGSAELELNEKLRLVIATPLPGASARPTKMIPLENVKEFEPLTEAMEAKLKADKEAVEKIKTDRKNAEAVARMPSALKGVTKFVKDPVTGNTVETQI